MSKLSFKLSIYITDGTHKHTHRYIWLISNMLMDTIKQCFRCMGAIFSQQNTDPSQLITWQGATTFPQPRDKITYIASITHILLHHKGPWITKGKSEWMSKNILLIWVTFLHFFFYTSTPLTELNSSHWLYYKWNG